MKAVNAGQDAAGNYYQGTDWAGSMSELTTIQSHPPKKKFRTKEFSSLFFNSIAYDALTAPAPFNAKDLLTARAVSLGSAHLTIYPQSPIHLLSL